MDLEHHKEALGHWSDEDEDEEDDEDDESDIEYDYYFGKLSTLYYIILPIHLCLDPVIYVCLMSGYSFEQRQLINSHLQYYIILVG